MPIFLNFNVITSLQPMRIFAAILIAGAGVHTLHADDVFEAELQAKKKEATVAFKKHVAPFVNTYCIECHGNRRTKGGLNLQPALKHPEESSATRKWIQAYSNVHANDMPPDDSDQPSDEERKNFLESLGKLKYLSAKDPGLFVIRRLTKMEYKNTLQDLLGFEITEADELPPEVPGQGYMNSLSPMQTEQFLSITNALVDRIFAVKAPGNSAFLKTLFELNLQENSDEQGAIKNAFRQLAYRAYRRPATEDELTTLIRVYQLGRDKKLNTKQALKLTIKALLVSPQFLFITPAEEVKTEEPIVPLDDYHLASRLSYFLWASMPDHELLDLASKKQLHHPSVLKAQLSRMLKSPKSHALFDGFGAQWLGMDKLEEKTFDAKKFPQMTPALRRAMIDEARLFFTSVIQENRSAIEFVDSDYTYLNQALAKIYGLESEVLGEEMRRVKLSNPNRGGILGMPGILATTSFPNRTSPVNRGVWVLEQVLGEVVPPAPPNVPALEKQKQDQVEKLTLRQRTELHRTDPVCANCHKILDPIGFGLENFDALGFWRDKDETGGPIDATGELPGGHQFSSPKELKKIIAARKADLARNLTEKLLAYALCRQLEGYDKIVVDRMMNTLEKNEYRMQSILTEIVTSYPFLHRRVKE